MKKKMLALTLCMSLLSACAGGLGGPTATATIDSAATAAIETEQVLNTQNAEATADALQATTDAEATNVSLTEAAASPTIRPLEVRRTREAGEAFGILESLYDGDFISTTEGSFLHLKAFYDSKAEINRFDWTFTEYAPGDFVFQSDIKWESASDIANWFNSGCGIVFREAGRGDKFYVVFLYLDGNVELFAYENHGWRDLASKYYGKPELPNGSAELLVTAEGNHIQVFVNSKLFIDIRDPRTPASLAR